MNKLNWIIKDNAATDVLTYDLNHPDLYREVIGVEFYVDTFEQRDEIIKLVEKWNRNE